MGYESSFSLAVTVCTKKNAHQCSQQCQTKCEGKSSAAVAGWTVQLLKLRWEPLSLRVEYLTNLLLGLNKPYNIDVRVFCCIHFLG